MKNKLIILLTAIILGLGAWIYFNPVIAVEQVTNVITEKPEIVDILKQYPDIEEKVKTEARIREIKVEIAERQSEIDTLTAELVELESKGFTPASTAGTN